MTGKVRVKITGACPEDCLTRITGQGIRFRDYVKKDVLTAEFTLALSDLKDLEAAAKKTMCEVEVLKIYGCLPSLRAMGPRLAYLGLLVGVVLLVFWIQGHIFFLEVEGNTTIPEEEILRILEGNGIGFWTRADELEMNLLKNQILSEIPELGWITINNEGPMATVVVRQREEKPVASEDVAPANILSNQSGVIEDVTVTGGTAQVKKGDVVTAGQLLISGVTNLDKTLLLTRAEGEVIARTFGRKTAVLLDSVTEKCYTGRETTGISVTFGKNTINFYKTSGISYDNYDKMTVRKTLTLPGGYELPLCLTIATFREYETVLVPMEEDAAQVLLTEGVRRDTEGKLSAGMILDMRLRMQQSEALYTMTGIVECRENIGVSVEIKD